MKSVTVCVIVCAIALNLSFNCAYPQRLPRAPMNVPRRTNKTDPIFVLGNYINVLHQQYDANTQRPNPSQTNDSDQQYNDVLIDRINATWLKCNETFSKPDNKIDVFSTNEVDPNGSRARKCLAECTLRVLGVLNDSEGDYITDNDYTKQIAEMKVKYPSLDIIDLCDENWSDLCEIIYDTECLELQDPYGNNCETSWMIMGCMLSKNPEKFFNVPFRLIFTKKDPLSHKLRHSMV